MPMLKKIISFFFLLILLLNAQPTATVNGFVFDQSSKETIIGANVYLQKAGLGASSNQSGYYSIPGVPAGRYTLICEYIGYQTHKTQITLKPGKALRVNIFLKEELLTSEAIVVQADSERTVEQMFRRPISKIELTPMEIKRIPQIAETDLLRSLQTLPGILPLSDFSSALYVRGGTPDQNLYMIDGADVYNPEHAFGIFSTFNTDAIKHVDMSKGGFGAEYGGRLSSIMDVTYLDGNREQWEGSVSVSLLSAKTTIQMPLGKSGSVSGSFRRTYFDQTVAKVIDDIPEYYFYDMNVKAFWDVNPDNKLTVSLFGGRDVMHFVINPDSDPQVGFDYSWGNTTASLRWTHILTPQIFTNFWVTRSTFNSNFDFTGIFDLNEDNAINDLTFKGYMEYAWSTRFQVQLGFENKNLDGTYHQVFPNGLADIRQTRNHYVGFLSAKWRPTKRWDVSTGLRYNYFHSQKDYQSLNPRFAVKYRLSDTQNLKFATGRYSQYLHRIPRGFFTSIWTASDQYQKGSTAYHVIAGYEKELEQNFSFQAETYYKIYQDIYTYNYNALTDVTAKGFDDEGRTIYNDTQGQFLHGKGSSAGVEFLLKKNSGAITGWLGYSYSRTRFTFDGINQNKAFAPRHDRTNTFNFVSTFDIKNLIREFKGERLKKDSGAWNIGLNVVYSTGQPITAPSSAYISNYLPDYDDVVSDDGQNGETYSIYPSLIDNYRLPPYARMDVSLTYRKQYETWSLAPYLQIFNVLNRGNVWFIQYQDESTPDEIVQKVETIHMLPLLPTLGVTIKF